MNTTYHPLGTIDTGGGRSLGFELSRDVEVAVLINSHDGELPEPGRSDNVAALFLDGDERTRIVGSYYEVIAWAKGVRQTLEGIDKAGHFGFISWSRLICHFNAMPRVQGPPKFYSTGARFAFYGTPQGGYVMITTDPLCITGPKTTRGARP